MTGFFGDTLHWLKVQGSNKTGSKMFFCSASWYCINQAVISNLYFLINHCSTTISGEAGWQWLNEIFREESISTGAIVEEKCWEATSALYIFINTHFQRAKRSVSSPAQLPFWAMGIKQVVKAQGEEKAGIWSGWMNELLDGLKLGGCLKSSNQWVDVYLVASASRTLWGQHCGQYCSLPSL